MKQSRFDQLRIWWVWRRQTGGLFIAGLAFVSVALLAMPFTAVTPAVGAVVELRYLGAKGAIEPYAVIEVSGQRSMVRLHGAHDCKAGSVITLQKRRTLTGVRYSAVGCHPADRPQ